ncbi:hypothetical protein HYV10_04405 [Candidatus Dependentiae bacterium]|nr:hypothetical protein [Candidatus Dependentiae bacterium]
MIWSQPDIITENSVKKITCPSHLVKDSVPTRGIKGNSLKEDACTSFRFEMKWRP